MHGNEQPTVPQAPVSDPNCPPGQLGKNKTGNTSAALESEQRDVPKNTQLEIEAVKIILSSSLDFIKTVGQTLQTLTSLLLTAYIALLVGFCKDTGFKDKWAYIWAFLPIASLVSSLVAAGVFALGYTGRNLVIYEDTGAHEPFKLLGEIVAARRRQIYLPAGLTLLGLVFIIVSFFAVITPAQRLKFSHASPSPSPPTNYTSPAQPSVSPTAAVGGVPKND